MNKKSLLFRNGRLLQYAYRLQHYGPYSVMALVNVLMINFILLIKFCLLCSAELAVPQLFYVAFGHLQRCQRQQNKASGLKVPKSILYFIEGKQTKKPLRE